VQHVNLREGKAMIAWGVAAMVSGMAVQAFNVHSAATQAPPQFATNAGAMTLVSGLAGLLIVTGLILSIVGVIRYAQSGGPSHATYRPATVDVPPSAVEQPIPAQPSAGAYCSACGARIVGVGRFCASCGTSTSH